MYARVDSQGESTMHKQVIVEIWTIETARTIAKRLKRYTHTIDSMSPMTRDDMRQDALIKIKNQFGRFFARCDIEYRIVKGN